MNGPTHSGRRSFETDLRTSNMAPRTYSDRYFSGEHRRHPGNVVKAMARVLRQAGICIAREWVRVYEKNS
jgi:hypothetical protein